MWAEHGAIAAYLALVSLASMPSNTRLNTSVSHSFLGALSEGCSNCGECGDTGPHCQRYGLHLIRISCNAAERNVFYASNAAPPKYPLTNSTGAPP